MRHPSLVTLINAPPRESRVCISVPADFFRLVASNAKNRRVFICLAPCGRHVSDYECRHALVCVCVCPCVCERSAAEFKYGFKCHLLCN